MFIFLIALKSKKVSADWQLTTRLLQQTLTSIQKQANPNHKTIIICNQKPDININCIDINEDNIEWVVVNFDDVDLSSKFSDKERDRAKKLLIGFEYSKQYEPTYLMPVDADDFVNCNITEYVLTHQNDLNGYCLESGYIYEQENNLIYIDRGFKDYCGSSLILKTDVFLNYFAGGIYLHNSSVNLNNFPLDGVIYNRCNGDNFAATQPLIESMGRADPKFVYKPITDDIISTFNLVTRN